jgi:lipopolysaccharide export system permease protein
MKLIYRYLFKDILHQFGLFVLIFTAIMLINETYDSRKSIAEQSPAAIDVIQFLIYSLPEQMIRVFPMIGLLGTMMAYGLQAKNREILAMIASGVSFKKLAIPAMVFGLGLTAACYWLNETVVPSATSRALYIEKVVIGGRSETIFTKRSNLFVKGKGNLFYYMQEYLPDQGLMIYPTLLLLNADGSGLAERLEADRAKIVTDDDGARFWEFMNAERWMFTPEGMRYEKSASPYRLRMEEDLDRFLSRNKKPEEMNIVELSDYVDMVEDRGGETAGRYASMMHQKIAFPVTCLLMTLLGFAAVLDLHARRFTRGVAIGLGVSIGYYVVEATMVSLGSDGVIAPAVAGWTAVIVFAGVVAALIARLEKIH